MPVTPEQAEQLGVVAEESPNLTMHSQFDILGTTLTTSDNFLNEILSYSDISILLDINSKDESEMTAG
ncbi:hypothetical protein [Lactococcus petauri]|uniref:hypothetical protein n=1 Tax=Lactococcus petauri TaxID=1940789 RepID=UPI0018ABAB4D|nr:hypothetical protein [Lactococcus petauri]MDC0826964.1 hypothetical protein [Lactococcus petauri]